MLIDGRRLCAPADALAAFQLDFQRSCTAQVHDALQQAILQGKIPPRTALSEVAISSVIKVSRTPVREALAQLAEEPLVMIYRQVGTFVAMHIPESYFAD